MKRRLASNDGFTLIELLIVLIILGILVAISVPSYLGFRAKAQAAAAQANVRTAVPAAEAWYQDTTNNSAPNTYTGLTGAKLAIEAPGINSTTTKAVALNSNAGYCIQDTQGVSTYDYIGGSATPQTGYAAATVQVGTCLAASGSTAT